MSNAGIAVRPRSDEPLADREALRAALREANVPTLLFLSWPYRHGDYWTATRAPNPSDMKLG